jgi:isoleucyl-tRNA synthetase
MAPILVYTADEAWENLPARRVPSVHMAEFSARVGAGDQADSLLANWERIFAIRDEVLKALEDARNEKRIGSSLEAKVVLTADKETTRFLLDYYDQLRYVFIVSQVEVHEGDPRRADTSVRVSVLIDNADGKKCERCWNYSVLVGKFERWPAVCERCNDALIEIVDGVQ